jgi:D-tyrosyl-tRNA(Tyr) deacylase
MRVVVQRSLSASVSVGGEVVGRIARGLVVLAAFVESDTEQEVRWMASKLAKLRIFADEEGSMNQSVKDVGGDVLLVSQFTLYAKVKKGNRPSFILSAKSEIAEPLYERFKEVLSEELGRTVVSGCFGEDMQVSLVNDGPVTLIVDTLGDV